MFVSRIAAASAALSLLAGIAAADGHASPVKVAGSGATAYITDGAGMTLYTFDKDSDGLSNCYDACAANWPPLAGAPGMALPEGFAVIARRDGISQIAYKGMPLYGWAGDASPGDMTGDGVNGVWHTARP